MKQPPLLQRLILIARSADGSSLVEMAFIMPVLVLVLMGTVDFGRAYTVAIQVQSAAEAGALYGTQNSTDTVGMITAAKLDGSAVKGMAATAVYGCECPDGTSASASCGILPTCAANTVNYIDVGVTAIYVPVLPYPGIPAAFALTGRSRMRAGR
jgi:Flp pilus assembly protein TadG